MVKAQRSTIYSTKSWTKKASQNQYSHQPSAKSCTRKSPKEHEKLHDEITKRARKVARGNHQKSTKSCTRKPPKKHEKLHEEITKKARKVARWNHQKSTKSCTRKSPKKHEKLHEEITKILLGILLGYVALSYLCLSESWNEYVFLFGKLFITFWIALFYRAFFGGARAFLLCFPRFSLDFFWGDWEAWNLK